MSSHNYILYFLIFQHTLNIDAGVILHPMTVTTKFVITGITIILTILAYF